MKKSILFLLATFSINLLISQAKLADILYTNFEYSTAAKIYSESENLTGDQLKNYAYSYYLNNNFQKSIPIFKQALEKNPDDFILKLRYSIALKSTGRYNSAQILLKELYSLDSSNKYIKLNITSIDSLLSWDTVKVFKKLASLESVNTSSSEFSPYFYDDGIFYIVEKGQEKSIANNLNFIQNNDSLSIKEKKQFTEKLNKILAYGNSVSPRTYAYKMNMDFSKLFKAADTSFPNDAILNNDLIISHKNFNITSIATDHLNEKVYYTRHPYLTNNNTEASLNPIIYQGKLSSNKKKISKRRRIPVRFLSSSVGSGEVSASSDGKTIYFVSDKKRV